MTRREQLNKFNGYIRLFEDWCWKHSIPYRRGGAWRSGEDAKRNAEMGVGIANSKHPYSLAQDYWIDYGGKNPVTSSSHPQFKEALKLYILMGEFWESIGGRWGGRWTMKNGENDYYHFEFKDKPA